MMIFSCFIENNRLQLTYETHSSSAILLLFSASVYRIGSNSRQFKVHFLCNLSSCIYQLSHFFGFAIETSCSAQL